MDLFRDVWSRRRLLPSFRIGIIYLVGGTQALAKPSDRCQRTGNLSRRNEIPVNYILEVEIFDVWGVDFIGPFPSS